MEYHSSDESIYMTDTQKHLKNPIVRRRELLVKDSKLFYKGTEI